MAATLAATALMNQQKVIHWWNITCHHRSHPAAGHDPTVYSSSVVPHVPVPGVSLLMVSLFQLRRSAELASYLCAAYIVTYRVQVQLSILLYRKWKNGLIKSVLGT